MRPTKEATRTACPASAVLQPVGRLRVESSAVQGVPACCARLGERRAGRARPSWGRLSSPTHDTCDHPLRAALRAASTGDGSLHTPLTPSTHACRGLTVLKAREADARALRCVHSNQRGLGCDMRTAGALFRRARSNWAPLREDRLHQRSCAALCEARQAALSSAFHSQKRQRAYAAGGENCSLGAQTHLARNIGAIMAIWGQRVLSCDLLYPHGCRDATPCCLKSSVTRLAVRPADASACPGCL